MKVSDYAKAFGVAVAVLVITLAASFPMVGVYRFFITPGQPPEFYTQAAQWIAPWSSHVFGPLVFGIFNYVMARRTPERPALTFATLTIVMYVLIEALTYVGMGFAPSAAATYTILLSMVVKFAGALAGAWLGSKK